MAKKKMTRDIPLPSSDGMFGDPFKKRHIVSPKTGEVFSVEQNGNFYRKTGRRGDPKTKFGAKSEFDNMNAHIGMANKYASSMKVKSGKARTADSLMMEKHKGYAKNYEERGRLRTPDGLVYDIKTRAFKSKKSK